MNDFRFRLKAEDSPVEDGAPEITTREWSNEDRLSAMSEAQLLEIGGKLGAIRKALLMSFEIPMDPKVRRLLRMALGHAEEASQLAQAVVGSTQRRSR